MITHENANKQSIRESALIIVGFLKAFTNTRPEIHKPSGVFFATPKGRLNPCGRFSR
jgi:hypothetical protein